MWMISFLLLFLLLFYIPTVHCGCCCAAVLTPRQHIFTNGKQPHWKSEAVNTRRMCLSVRMRVSLIPVKMTLFSFTSFVEPPCVVLEWKSRFSCFLWTSLSSGIVLPLCGCSAECLYIVTTLARPNSHIFSIRPSLFHKSSHRSSFVT